MLCPSFRSIASTENARTDSARSAADVTETTKRNQRLIKYWRTRAKRARINAAAIRAAADKPGNSDVRASLLAAADKYDATAEAAQLRAAACSSAMATKLD